MKKALSMLLLMVMTLACLSGAAMADSDKYLGVMLSTNVMSLDTNLATDGESFEVIADCIDGLMQMDATGASIPALAESYDMSEDGLTYTFHLRDAKWSNGTPVTASDFVFAWRRICKEAGEYAYMFGSSVGCVKGAQDIIDGKAEPDTLAVSAPDDKTLVVELESPVSFFASLMYFPTFYPINEAFYSSLEEGTYGTSPETFLSNGAFVLESYTPGTASLTVKKNPDYWDADRVKLAGIKYQVVGSSDNALVAFKTGALNVVTISGNQVASAKKDADLASKLAVTGAGYMWYLTFSQTEKNADGGMLANANLRLAISNAIDRESIVENNVMDGSLATYTAVPPQFAASSTTGADFSEDQMKFVDYCDFNVEKALEYLAKAKEELGKDSFTFTLIYGNNEGEVIIRHLYRDREYEQEMIYLEREFWHDHILTRIPPPYTEDGSLILESLRRRLGAADKTIPAIELDSDLSATMLRYLRLQEQKQQVETQAKTLDTEMQRLKGQMVAKLNGSCMAMGEYGGTQYTISYNPVSRTGITKDNLQKLKLLHPDIYDEYVTVSESRRFSIKAKAADEAA